MSNLRSSRPYFLVNLLDARFPYEDRVVADEITAYAANALPTDVFVVSHGWHRNLFDGVMAYDRLFSRLAGLDSRRRLQLTKPAPFRPIFIGLHWNSDPGTDEWLDRTGRRDKIS